MLNPRKWPMAALVGLDEARRRSTLPKAVFDALLLLSAQRYEMAAVKFEAWAAAAGDGPLPLEAATAWLGECLTLRQETKAGRGSRDGGRGARRLFASPALAACAAAVRAAAEAAAADGAPSAAALRAAEVFGQLRWSEGDHAAAAAAFRFALERAEAPEPRLAKALGTCEYFLGDYGNALRNAARGDSCFLAYCVYLCAAPTDPRGFAARREVARRGAAALARRPTGAVDACDDPFVGADVALGWLASPSLRLRGADPTVYDDDRLYASRRGEGDGFAGNLASADDGDAARRVARDFDPARAAALDGGPYAVVFATGPENYYHLLLEFGAKVAALKEASHEPAVAACLAEATWLLPESQGAALQRELLGLLGFARLRFYDPSRPQDLPGGCWVVDCGAVGRGEACGAPSLHDACTPSLGGVLALRRAVAAALGLGGPADGDAVAVYVSRRGGSRRVLDERALLGALEAWSARAVPKLRWVAFAGAPATLAAQAALFGRAALVVGPHGAGLANLAFVPATCRVLELPIRHNANKMFQFLCRGLGLRHAVATRAAALYTGHFDLDETALAEIAALLDGLFDPSLETSAALTCGSVG